MNKEKVFSIVAAVIEVSPSDITIDSVNDDFEGWDSIAHMTIVTALEEETGEMFSEEEIVEMLSIEGMLQVVGV